METRVEQDRGDRGAPRGRSAGQGPRTGRELLVARIGLGELVLQSCFGGSIERWRQGGPGDVPMRELATRLGKGGPTQLERAIAIYDLDARLRISECSGITLSHVHPLLPLPHRLQEELLGQAVAQRWSARRLGAEVRRRTAVPAFDLDLIALAQLTRETRRLLERWREVPDRATALDLLSRLVERELGVSRSTPTSDRSDRSAPRT